MKYLSSTQSHFNRTTFAKWPKLSKFSIAMLEEIFKYFELDTSTMKQKQKKPYVDLLDAYVKSCTCS